MVRVSPGSPSQWKATRSPRPASTWRSTQLTATLSLPPTNHLANGSFHSSTSVQGVSQVSRLAWDGPEGQGVGLGLGVDAGLRVGLLGELLGRGEGPGLVEQGRQPFLSGLAHCSLLSGLSGSDADPLIITYAAGFRFNGSPVGRTFRPPMPLMTPAAEAYQAQAAVTMPGDASGLHHVGVLEKFPMARRMKVTSRVRKTANTARLTNRLHRSM